MWEEGVSGLERAQGTSKVQCQLKSSARNRLRQEHPLVCGHRGQESSHLSGTADTLHRGTIEIYKGLYQLLSMVLLRIPCTAV